MKKLAFLFSTVTILFFPNLTKAQCNDSNKFTISVPSQFQTIAAAISEAKTNSKYKDITQKITINVAYNVKPYRENQVNSDKESERKRQGLLINRDCLSIIGVPNPNEEKPIIQKESFDNEDATIIKITSNNVVFKNFEVKGKFIAEKEKCKLLPIGIKVEGETKNLSELFLENNNITTIGHDYSNGYCINTEPKEKNHAANAHAIYIGSNNEKIISGIHITGNTLSNLQLGSSETITIKNNIQDFHINYNTISNTDNIGIDIIGFEEKTDYQAQKGEIVGNKIYGLSTGNGAYPSVAGIYIDGGRDIIIYGNEVYDFGYGIEVASEKFGATVSNVIIDKNVLHNNLVAGIGIGHSGDQSGFVENCAVVNNKSFDNGSKENGGQLRLISDIEGGLKNIKIENNAFCVSKSDSGSRLIYTENCKNKHCKNNEIEKLGVRFLKNIFYSYNFTNAWYFNGDEEFSGSDSIAYQKLYDRFKKFDKDNVFGKDCEK